MAIIHETEAQPLQRAAPPARAAKGHRGWGLLLVLFVLAELAWVGLLGFAFVRLVT